VPWHVHSAGLGFWSLTKHADVQWASRDPETFVSGDGFTLIDIDPHDLRALIEYPDELEKLRRDPGPESISVAVEEVLRWSSPIHYFRRRATRDVELRGMRIATGEWLWG
jgi:hypothetical protein